MSTIFCTKDVDAAVRALVKQYNALHQATISTTFDGYHRDISGVASGEFSNPSSATLAVSAASATNLSTTILSALNSQGVLHVHLADDSAHLKIDQVGIDKNLDGYLIDNTSSTTQQTTVNSLLNQAKSVFNAHLSQSGVHLKSDLSTVSTPDATNLATSETLANALKAAINSHIASGPSCGRIKLL